LSGAIFRREVLFRNTIFGGKFYPRNTKFNDNVNFRGAEFTDADFYDTLFKDKANFHDVTFRGAKTRFRNVKFEGIANFDHTRFCGETGFWGTSFRETKFSPDVVFDKMTTFRYVLFENGEKVEFSAKDLSKVSFLNTDITRVKFAEDVSWGSEDRFTVVDEREMEKELKSEEPIEQYLNKYFLFKWKGKYCKTKNKKYINEKHNQRIHIFLLKHIHQALSEM
jgi:hypothetical protein